MPVSSAAGPCLTGNSLLAVSAGGGSRPGTAATTPGRPPRTPGTPGTGLGPLARHMDSFDVMESPAVHEALAGRPSHPGTAGNSPASLASSPGFVSGDMHSLGVAGLGDAGGDGG